MKCSAPGIQASSEQSKIKEIKYEQKPTRTVCDYIYIYIYILYEYIDYIWLICMWCCLELVQFAHPEPELRPRHLWSDRLRFGRTGCLV